MLISLTFKNDPCVSHEAIVNSASLMSDFYRASPKMAWLRLFRITNESTETENRYSSLNRELRWLWNSVYINFSQCLEIFLFKSNKKGKLYNPKPKSAMCSSSRNKVGGINFRVT